MTILGILIGAPIGVLAGTYLAEYGRTSPLSAVIRFVNDVLLSAPSIIVGLFVYEVMVVGMGHFSAIAGAVALGVIAISGDGAHDGRHAASGASGHEGRLHCAGCAHVAHDHQRDLPGGPERHHDRSAARRGAYQWRDGAVAFHGAQQSVLGSNLNAPMANLPVVIFQFALSPYKDWQKLAWSGALIITLTILLLSILARVVVSGMHGGQGAKR